VYPKHPIRERHKKARQPPKNLARLGCQATIKNHFKLRIMKRKAISFLVAIVAVIFISVAAYSACGNVPQSECYTGANGSKSCLFLPEPGAGNCNGTHKPGLPNQ
jgi:hypothetical protein